VKYPAGAGIKTALAAAVIQQEKLFEFAIRQQLTELFSSQIAFKLDAQFSQARCDNLFRDFTSVPASGVAGVKAASEIIT
jgi:hypothetical protein